MIVNASAGNDYVLGASVGNIEMRFFGGAATMCWSELAATMCSSEMTATTSSWVAGAHGIVGGRCWPIHGAAGDDILIAAVLNLPNMNAGLTDIRNEWTSQRTFPERVFNLQNPGPQAADTLLQVANTVFDDIDPDRLFGGLDADWYFANLDQDLSPHEPGTDEITNLAPPP